MVYVKFVHKMAPNLAISRTKNLMRASVIDIQKQKQMNCLEKPRVGESAQRTSKHDYQRIHFKQSIACSNSQQVQFWIMSNCRRFRWKSMLYSLQEIKRIYNEHMCLDQYSIQSNKREKRQKPNLVEEKQILSKLVLQMTWAPIPCPWKKLKHCENGHLPRELKCGD